MLNLLKVTVYNSPLTSLPFCTGPGQITSLLQSENVLATAAADDRVQPSKRAWPRSVPFRLIILPSTHLLIFIAVFQQTVVIVVANYEIHPLHQHVRQQRILKSK